MIQIDSFPAYTSFECPIDQEVWHAHPWQGNLLVFWATDYSLFSPNKMPVSCSHSSRAELFYEDVPDAQQSQGWGWSQAYLAFLLGTAHKLFSLLTRLFW